MVTDHEFLGASSGTNRLCIHRDARGVCSQLREYHREEPGNFVTITPSGGVHGRRSFEQEMEAILERERETKEIWTNIDLSLASIVVSARSIAESLAVFAQLAARLPSLDMAGILKVASSLGPLLALLKR